MQMYYLEIVTPDVASVCESYSKTHGVSFGEPVPELGNACTAALKDGGKIGVRAPMHETETPVARPYWLVDDIEAAVESAVASGAELAHPPLELPGQGTFAVLIQGGIQYGLWKL
ncbi:MAG: hydroxylase [Pseudomonadota bacterium]